MTGRIIAPIAATVALLFAATAAPAQENTAAPRCSFRASGQELADRLSPPDSASASLDGGEVKVCYSSPRARGREIMGELVPYGQPWRLGANEPTTLHVTSPVRIGDVRVEAGSYSLYAVPGREQWTVVVNGATDRWGVPIDDEVRAEDLGTVTVEASRTEDLVENLTLSFERGEEGGVHLTVEWERTRLEVPVRPAGS